MNQDDFWKLIKKSRRGTEDCDKQVANLTTMLEQLSPQEITEFNNLLWNLLGDSYQWDLWAVAYILHGGCSEDKFLYFRCWLILQGQQFFEQVLAEPSTIERRVKGNGTETKYELLLTVAGRAYANKTGEEIPQTNSKYPAKPSGTKWKEEDLDSLYPKLMKKFW